MGLITVFVEMLKGEQKSVAQPVPRGDAGFHGKIVEKPLQAPQELLRALTEAATMFRDDHIAGLSAGGTLLYQLKSIVAYIPEPYLSKVAFATQPLKVRVENAKAVLVPVFARHKYIDIAGLADWKIKKKEETASQVEDGFSDAYIAQPDSGIGVEFAFEGAFLTDTEISTGKVKPDCSEGRATTAGVRLEYRLKDDKGRQLEAGEISDFPTTIGRDLSDINVSSHLSLVSGTHVRLSLSENGQVLAEHLGGRNGTYLIQHGGHPTQIKGPGGLPRTGTLILGAPDKRAKVAMIEFCILGGSGIHTRTQFAQHAATDCTPGDHGVKQPAKATRLAQDRANETKLEQRKRSGKYGVLVLKYSNGDREIRPIDKLPFTIGREPHADGGQVAVVRAGCEKVSRNHVRIEDVGKTGMHAVNLQGERNLCFLGSNQESGGFIWSFSHPNDPNAKWLKLGGETLEAETVWGQIHAANAND